MPDLTTIFWIAALSVVAVSSFLAGVAFGRGFWLDVTWLRTRR